MGKSTISMAISNSFLHVYQVKSPFGQAEFRPEALTEKTPGQVCLEKKVPLGAVSPFLASVEYPGGAPNSPRKTFF